MKLVFVIFFVFTLSACADTYQLLRTDLEKPKLDRSKTVYVLVPKDGRYGQIDYAGSGLSTAQVVVMSFSQYFVKVESGRTFQTYEDALKSSRQAGAAYLIVPTILEWEDRATEWSGIPDKASVKISIINIATGETVDSVIIKSKSGLATFGGDHPQDLLPKPISEYVKYLFE
jgi:hypothetical protein